ncbi:MAG: hypothetical protein OQJ84_12845 [Xanthomonadales bacterium]|nr:hypothetical protein [Xanthomonadales bacterium]
MKYIENLIDRLFAPAKAASEKAYSPYSGARVGVAFWMTRAIFTLVAMSRTPRTA